MNQINNQKLRVVTRRDLHISTQAVQSALFNFFIYLYNMKKLTLQNFVNVSNVKHDNKYDYSKVELIGSKTKVTIICPIHGEFEQTPDSHLRGSGCIKCSYEQRADNSRKKLDSFVEKGKKLHGNKYDYSNVNYNNTHTAVKINCSIHGEFEQDPSHHLRGSGCPKCGNNVKSKDFFISKSIETHGDYYDYSKVDFINTKLKVTIICPIHGEFNQTPSHHYNGAGCPICRESKGEREIRNYLIDKQIKYKPQHRFKDCRDKKPLPFDFYLPEHNTCIEFDGEQHFKVKEQWGGVEGLLDRQRKDKIKTEYCKENNINLIRITNIKNLKL